uniref:Fibrosin n=1 Tax=Molossus molossus TaxID=27622 RepID=A0A7J8IXU5_MOLMO|nr:fibrosin [Molossus molossus]
MHVRVAYMILRHQEKMKGDSHKLDFRNDLLPCLPGPYGALPTGQELSHPAASLFTATGAVHAAANPFTAAPGAHGPFLSPSTHIDPFGRPTSFASLAALSNGAFGGLGSPTFNSGAVFAQKESPGAPPAFASPPDPWGRLHRSPLAFPAWVRPPEAARTPGSDKERPVERRESSITKEEKDRYASRKLSPHLPLNLCLTSGVPLFSSPTPAPQGPPLLTAPAPSISCYSQGPGW